MAEEAVMLKLTTLELVLLLVKVPLIVPVPDVPNEEVMPEGLVLVQAVIEPATTPETAIGVIEAPLQVFCAKGDTVGNGLTVTVTGKGVPLHPLAEGVML